MYAKAFNLRTPPFDNAPDPRFFYPSPGHEEALATLVYVVGECKGLALLTGEPGTGKSYVARLMLEHFGPRIHVVRLSASTWTGTSLLIAVCDGFNVPAGAGHRVERHPDRLRERLIQDAVRGRPAVLVVDDAHLLPDEAFQTLRSLTAMENGGPPLLQVVLLGGPELRRRLDESAAASLRHRVYRACTLHPLTREQTAGFLCHRLAVAGAANCELFDESAIDLIFQLARGTPQRINIVADNVLLSAFARDIRLIDAAFVRSLPDLTLHVERRTDESADHDAQPLRRGPARGRSRRRRTRPAEEWFTRLVDIERRIARLDHLSDAVEYRQAPPSRRPAEFTPDIHGRLDDLADRLKRIEDGAVAPLPTTRDIREHDAGSDNGNPSPAGGAPPGNAQSPDGSGAAGGAPGSMSSDEPSSGATGRHVPDRSSPSHRSLTVPGSSANIADEALELVRDEALLVARLAADLRALADRDPVAASSADA